jgi:hypothetical protein
LRLGALFEAAFRGELGLPEKSTPPCLNGIRGTGAIIRFSNRIQDTKTRGEKKRLQTGWNSCTIKNYRNAAE